MGLDSRRIDFGKCVCGDCEHLESGVSTAYTCVVLCTACPNTNLLTVLELQSPIKTERSYQGRT